MAEKIMTEETFTTGRISFGKSNIQTKKELVDTGEYTDGRTVLRCGLSITVYSKPNEQGKREVLYSGPEIHMKGMI